MQIYRRMDIGTAKPTSEEQALVPHHMLDIVEPDASFSVAQYVDQARQVIRQIHERGHLPLLVGGTGLYLQGLTLPFDYGGLPSDPDVRSRLHDDLNTIGEEHLHQRLSVIDPVSAAKYHPHDTRRVIRALEVFELTGVPMSEHTPPSEADSPYNMQIFAVDWPRDELHRRINLRVDQMIQAGLAEEVHDLLESGVTPAAQSMQGLGYKELIPFIEGRIPLSDAVEAIKTGTRNYARRQLTWFRRYSTCVWLQGASPATAKETILQNWRLQNGY